MCVLLFSAAAIYWYVCRVSVPYGDITGSAEVVRLLQLVVVSNIPTLVLTCIHHGGAVAATLINQNSLDGIAVKCCDAFVPFSIVLLLY